MNTSMLINALNGIMVDGVFVRNEDIEEMTFECERCGDRHLRGDGDENIYRVDGEDWCEACYDEDSFECERCGCRHSADVAYTVTTRRGSELWCENCWEWNTVTCERCGESVDSDYAICIDDYSNTYVCEDCIDDYTQCDCCGEWHLNDGVTEVRGGEYVCDSCLENEYEFCDECNEWVLSDEYNHEHDMCNDCWADRAEMYEGSSAETITEDGTIEDSNSVARSDNAIVRPYHSRPYIHFFGARNALNNTAYAGIGVELEVDVLEGQRAEFKQRALNRIDRIAGDRLYFNADCSLRNGFEIITQPHTLDAFNEIPWDEIMNACKENGFSSHDAGTCGLHVHFSRLMFGDDTETQDDNISKLVQFFEFYWDDMVKASRREGDQLRWCNKKGYISKKRIKDYVKNKWGGHSEAINNSNRDTVEIRIMRGTTNIKSFNACIDLLVTLVKNSCRVGWDEVCEADEMLKGIKSETAQYLTSKGAFTDTVHRLF